MVLFLNWISPSGIKNATKEVHVSVMSSLTQNDSSLGVVMMPEWTYKKGQLWLVETGLLRQLALANVNVDRSFMLQFKDKAGTL